MPAPVFVAEYESSNWTGNPATKTASVTTAPGDVLVLVAGMSNGGSTLVPSGGTGLTWTLQQSVLVSSSWAGAYVWTATASTAETFTLTVTLTGDEVWGFNCLRFSGSSGIGASAKANVNATSTVAVTTTAANSAIAVISVDWDALDGTTRTWSSSGGAPTERTYFRDAAWYTVYVANHPDAGSAGVKNVGTTLPMGQKVSIIGVEILAGSSNTPPTAGAGTDQVDIEPWTTVNLAGTDSDSDGTVVSRQWTQISGTTVTLSGATTANASFTAPATIAGGTLVFQYAVTDDDSAVTTDQVSITVLPVAERAVVGGVEVPLRVLTV